MKDKVEHKQGEGEQAADHSSVDPVRGETQMYGLTAPDPSRPQISRGQDDARRSSSMVSFGDKKIDLDKLRDSYIGEIVAGRFKITQFIDRGGMGEVYLGENEAVGQRVAVKFLNRKFTSDESIVTRFGNEAKSYARVNHPNAVTLLDYGQHDDGALYIITEFVDGKSLSKTMKKAGPFNAHQVISIGQQCCDVLTTAHKLGVIHRDLKPDNIMLIPNARERYTVKILDFGIAKLSDDEHGSMTETGAIFGTPEFMSPEQARGDGADPRSDLYALGVILYYMLTGKLPFSGKNKFAVLNKHLNDPAPRPSDIAPHVDVLPALEGVIMKCLNKRPEERYQSGEALYETLEDVRDLLGSLGSTTTSAPRIRKPDVVDSYSEASLDEFEEDSELEFEEDSEPMMDELEVPQTDELEPVDESLDLSRDEGAPLVQLGAYASLPGVVLDEEIDELDEEDELDAWEEWETDEGSGRFKMLLGAMLLVALIGGIGWYVMQLGEGDVMTRVGDSSLDAITGVGDDLKEQGSSDEIQKILVTSQVLGLLASAEEAVSQGDLSDARRQIETTKMWLEDDALPAEGLRRRQALEHNIQGLFTREKELKRLRAENRCKELERQLGTLSKDSPGLEQKWQKIAQECVSQDGSRPGKNPTTPHVNTPPVKDDKPAAKPPVPGDSIKDITPDKPVDKDPFVSKDPVVPVDPVDEPDDTPPKDVTPPEDDGLPPKVL